MLDDVQGVPCIGGRYEPKVGDPGGLLITNLLLPDSWDVTPYVAHSLSPEAQWARRSALVNANPEAWMLNAGYRQGIEIALGMLGLSTS